MAKDGQKIARKLSIQITKETQKLKALLQEYNACHVGGGDNSNILLFSDITDTSKLAQILHPSVSYSVDKQELIEAYLLSKRSAEELRLLELDMTNVIQYHKRRVEVLATAVCNPSDISEIGALSVLHNHLQEAKHQLQKCKELFTSCSNSPQLHSVYESDSDISSESDSDSDNDI